MRLAIEFCRPGDTITVSGERTDGAVRFTVADTGPGVPGEAAAHLFEPYWSAPEHARRGSGLGLYISRGIVEAHGGRIWIEDTPGGGARLLVHAAAAGVTARAVHHSRGWSAPC